MSFHELPMASELKPGVMLLIFLVSLLAVSFPGLSKRVSFLNIPRVVFFIGKHFGTGVILSTAFCHLLPDAFESLNHPLVKEKGNTGHYAGMIILASLLTIFTIEYVCTAYVDIIQHAEPSEQDSVSTRPPSITSFRPHDHSHSHTPTASASTLNVEESDYPSEHTPLIRAECIRLPKPTDIAAVPEDGRVSVHTIDAAWQPQILMLHRLCALSVLTDMVEPGKTNSHRDEEFSFGHSHDHGHDASPYDDGHSRISKNRQVVGILVLQFGIMIHSSVIGLTLSITSGTDFATLVTAITFHQLFEGLSLGVRIASIPSSDENDNILIRRLPSILSMLFALTTPLGMLVGFFTLTSSNSDSAKMLLTQGVMSAISSGMLIYAACVEMLAADFMMDNTLRHSSFPRQFMAIGSVFLGAAAMAFVD